MSDEFAAGNALRIMQEEVVLNSENTSVPDGADTARSTGRSTLAATIHWARDLMVSVVIAAVIILFIYQPVKVEGTSMMPALVDQERIFISKFIYRFGVGSIDRSDMVVFWFPRDPSKSYIKRVIGVPGDVVEVDSGTVLLNGQPLHEAYVPEEYRDQMSMPATRVPEDRFFVLGDHRSSSNDSRSWGMVPRSNIYGKAVFIYWPLDKIGVIR
jgi:signal peptidase I